jgi:transaldolase
MKAYFHRVTEQTPTRFWINNPSRAEAALAIENGAVGCTTNPSFTQKMVDHPQDGAYATQLLDGVIKEAADDNEAQACLQRKLAGPVAEEFLPMFNATQGQDGNVSIQGNPLQEHEADTIIRDALENRKVGPNIVCKVPVTAAGLQAMEYLFAQNIPVNATEIMAIQQAIDVIELYQRVTSQAGCTPRLWVSQIAGIFDDHIQDLARREQIDISPDVLWQGGLAIGRKLYRLMQERHYPGTFIAGGARGLHHFTEMVGGDVCCTINWMGTADKLLQENPPVVYRLFNPVPDKVIAELLEKLPVFRSAYLEGGLSVEEYDDFGPVSHFRNSFIKSWQRVLDLTRQRRAVINPA